MAGRRRVAASAAASAAAAVALLAGGLTGAQGAAAEPLGRYVVVLDETARGQVDTIVAEHVRAHGLQAGFRYSHAVVGYAAVIPEGEVAALRASPHVKAVAPDLPVRATAQVLPTGIDRVQADVSSARAGDGSGAVDVGVAVIDTGIDTRHPDLNVVGGTNCVSTRPGASYRDNNGHGTHVAGTIGARDNGSDVVGIAPGARLYSVKVLNSAGRGYLSNIVCGLDWVADNAARLGIKVANMSLGGAGTDDGDCGLTNGDPEHQAICRVVDQAGVTMVAAAGNSTNDLAGFVPAGYDEVLTVTAVADFDGRPGGGAAATCYSDVDDTAADFSSFAVGAADAAHTIAGPGACITSTRLGGGTTVLSGTSMASPHVAGTAALCLAGPSCAGLTPAQVRAKLRSDAAAQPVSYGFTGDPNHSPVSGRYYGHLVHAGGY
ncbi:S8 family serine peptidase [Streptomyces sp. NPDC004788]